MKKQPKKNEHKITIKLRVSVDHPLVNDPLAATFGAAISVSEGQLAALPELVQHLAELYGSAMGHEAVAYLDTDGDPTK